MNDFYNILNFTKSEKRVYEFLQTGQFLVSEVTNSVGLPRMTVHDVLQKLLRRNLVKRIKRNKRFYYSAIEQGRILQALFPKYLREGVVEIQKTDVIGFVFHSGVNELTSVYEEMVRRSVSSRLYIIQPNTSIISAVKKVPLKALAKVNKGIKDGRVIIETIVEEDILDVTKKVLGNEYNDWVKNVAGRMTVMHAIPQDVMSFSSEIVIYKDTAVFISWQDETAVEIKHKQIIEMILALFKVFQSMGKKIHLQDAIR